jgi:hypothetical protein
MSVNNLSFNLNRTIVFLLLVKSDLFALPTSVVDLEFLPDPDPIFQVVADPDPTLRPGQLNNWKI